MPETAYRLLVCDDDEDVRLTILLALRHAGFESLGAASGREALQMLGKESVHAVLLDVVMPGMDGFEVLKQIKSAPATRHLPVIMLTGVNDMATMNRCLKLGALDYAVKPLDIASLQSVVSRALATKSPDAAGGDQAAGATAAPLAEAPPVVFPATAAAAAGPAAVPTPPPPKAPVSAAAQERQEIEAVKDELGTMVRAIRAALIPAQERAAQALIRYPGADVLRRAGVKLTDLEQLVDEIALVVGRRSRS
jgi:CheY-like chemotaxis protein